MLSNIDNNFFSRFTSGVILVYISIKFWLINFKPRFYLESQQLTKLSQCYYKSLHGLSHSPSTQALSSWLTLINIFFTLSPSLCYDLLLCFILLLMYQLCSQLALLVCGSSKLVKLLMHSINTCSLSYCSYTCCKLSSIKKVDIYYFC